MQTAPHRKHPLKGNSPLEKIFHREWSLMGYSFSKETPNHTNRILQKMAPYRKQLLTGNTSLTTSHKKWPLIGNGPSQETAPHRKQLLTEMDHYRKQPLKTVSHRKQSLTEIACHRKQFLRGNDLL